jgi:hypothetical protein
MSALPPTATAKADFCTGVMSALPPKADMSGANKNVRFGPVADIFTYLMLKQKETALAAVSPISSSACSRGSGLSVGLQEGQKVGIYRACLGGRAAVREALVSL